MTIAFDQPSDIIAEQRDRLAIATMRHKKQLPLIMFEECYIYFDDWCQIVAVRGEYRDEYMEVVVENGSGTRAHVEFKQLNWKFGRRVASHCRERQFVDWWNQYEL